MGLVSPSGSRLGHMAVVIAPLCINDQWRICFRWTEGGADDVEIVDYHG
jgi:plasmid maintenance system killer protein